MHTYLVIEANDEKIAFTVKADRVEVIHGFFHFTSGISTNLTTDAIYPIVAGSNVYYVLDEAKSVKDRTGNEKRVVVNL